MVRLMTPRQSWRHIQWCNMSINTIRMFRQLETRVSNTPRANMLFFLDGDDRLLTHALETGVRYLDANPDCAFIAGEHRYISESGSPLESIEQQRRVTKDYYRELLLRNFIGCPATVMHRRDVLEAVGGFDTNINPTGDWDLYLRIAHRFPMGA